MTRFDKKKLSCFSFLLRIQHKNCLLDKFTVPWFCSTAVVPRQTSSGHVLQLHLLPPTHMHTHTQAHRQTNKQTINSLSLSLLYVGHHAFVYFRVNNVIHKDMLIVKKATCLFYYIGYCIFRLGKKTIV